MLLPASLGFIAITLVIAIIVLLTPKKYNSAVLATCSCVFIGACDVRFLVLALITSLITWLAGDKISEREDRSGRRNILAAAILFLLLMLTVFRYLAPVSLFFVNSAGRYVVPVGMAVYTLKAIGYLMDIYRGELESIGLTRCLGYLLYFPALTAGPVTDCRRFTEQSGGSPDITRFREGILHAAWGFFLKLGVADNISAFTDVVFAKDYQSMGAVIAAGAILLTIQLYCTFRGLFSIAEGISLMLGIDITEDNDSGIARHDFRYMLHPSLANWLNKYLYRPIAGKTSARRITAFVFTAAAAGAWFGLRPHYIVWAILLWMAESVLARSDAGSRLVRALLFCINAAAVSLINIFFRCSIRGALTAFAAMAGGPWGPRSLKESMLETAPERFWYVLAAGIAAVLVCELLKAFGIRLPGILLRIPSPVRWLTLTALILFTIIFGAWGFGYHHPQALCDFLRM